MAKLIVPENKVYIQLENNPGNHKTLQHLCIFRKLTPVESLLFPFYAFGISAKRTAKITRRSIKTIEAHWAHCRMKLDLVKRYDALQMIIDRGCVLDCADMIKELTAQAEQIQTRATRWRFGQNNHAGDEATWTNKRLRTNCSRSKT